MSPEIPEMETINGRRRITLPYDADAATMAQAWEKLWGTGAPGELRVVGPPGDFEPYYFDDFIDSDGLRWGFWTNIRRWVRRLRHG